LGEDAVHSASQIVWAFALGQHDNANRGRSAEAAPAAPAAFRNGHVWMP
jgi:hypothetical protein